MKWFFIIIGTMIVLSQTVEPYLHREPNWIIILSGLVLLILSRLDELKEVIINKEGLKIITSLKEAKKKSEDASKMLVGVCKIIIQQIYAKGGFQSMSIKTQDEIREQVYKTLIDNNIDKDEIEEVRKIEFPHVCNEYWIYIEEILRDLNIDKDILTQLNNISFYDRSPERMENILIEILTNENLVNEKLSYFKYYYKNKEHSNKIDWSNRENWRNEIEG